MTPICKSEVRGAFQFSEKEKKQEVDVIVLDRHTGDTLLC